MTTLIVNPQNAEQLKIVEAFLNALSIPFGAEGKEESYDPAFVAKIQQSRKDIAEGKGIEMTMAEVLALCR